MKLSREKIQRMIDTGAAGSGGSGGINPSELAGYATQSWVDGSYVAKAFWNQVFEIRGTKTTTVGTDDPTVEDYVFMPNELPATTTTTEGGVTTTVVTAITNIKAKVGLWTPSYLSALGQNSSGGGGGGGTLAGLSDVQLTNPTDGQVLKYNATLNKWINADESGGGGGGSGTVTSITMSVPSGFSVSPATITTSGTFTIGFGGTLTKNMVLATPAAANGAPSWRALVAADIPDLSSVYATTQSITDMATKTWVNQQSFLTQTAADNRYISIAFFARLFQAKNGSANINPNDTTSTIDSIKALFGFWTDQYISALGQNSGGGGGGVSLNEPLSSINTSNMIAPTAEQNGMTIVWDNATSKWKYGAVGTPYTLPLAANGTRGGIQIGFTTEGSNRNYAVLLSNEKAYVNVPWTDTNTWRPVQDNLTSTSTTDSLSANQGKVLKGYIDTLNSYFDSNGNAKTALKLATPRTIWGQSFDGSANVSGTMYDVVSIVMTGSIIGTQSIEMNTNGVAAGHGGFIDFHYGGSDVDYSSRIIEEESGRLTIQSKATVADPTKGISKGDFIPSGLIISGGHDESFLQIGDIRLIYDQENNAIKAEKYNGQAANFYATGGVSALGVPTSGSGTVDTLNVNTLKAVNNLYIGDNANRIYFDSDADELVIKSGSDYISMNGVINMVGSTATTRAIYTNGGNLSLDGGRLYLAGGVYLFFESNNVKVSINGTIYTLNKS